MEGLQKPCTNLCLWCLRGFSTQRLRVLNYLCIKSLAIFKHEFKLRSSGV